MYMIFSLIRYTLIHRIKVYACCNLRVDMKLAAFRLTGAPPIRLLSCYLLLSRIYIVTNYFNSTNANSINANRKERSLIRVT